jgi:hypothetical protein
LYDPDGSQRKTVLTSGLAAGYVKEILASKGDHFDIIPIETGASSSTYYCDNSAFGMGNTAVLRSGAGSEQDGGIAYIQTIAPSTIGQGVSSRLAFRGVIVEAQSVTEFKALPLL